MDAALLNGKVNYGYAKAASIVGLPCQQYRPSGPNAPLATPIGTLSAAFDQDSKFSLTKPWNRSKGEGYALADTTALAVGDYLLTVREQVITINGQPITFGGQNVTFGSGGSTTLTIGGQPIEVGGVTITFGSTTTVTPDTTPSAGTDVYFVERLEQYRPAEVVLCNVVLSFTRPGQQVAPGQGAYGGRMQATDVVLATGWPASMLFKGRGEIPGSRLPTDVRAGAYEVLLPPIPTVSLMSGDRMTDANGTEYLIYAVEPGPWGYRLLAGVATT